MMNAQYHFWQFLLVTYISFQLRHMWTLVFRATQSNADLMGQLSVRDHIVQLPRGYGRRTNNMIKFKDLCQRGRGIIYVE